MCAIAEQWPFASKVRPMLTFHSWFHYVRIYIYIYISVRILIYLHLAQAGAAVTKALMDTPCLRGHCRCAGLTVSLDLAQIFLAQPEGIQHCSKDGGLSVWICGRYVRWTDHCTIVPPDSRVGKGSCLQQQRLIVILFICFHACIQLMHPSSYSCILLLFHHGCYYYWLTYLLTLLHA